VVILNQIRKADYAGNRPTVRRLSGELAHFDGEKELTARVPYWRGFALWQWALQIVPDWHYVRDILKPQIRAAKSKQVS
jgi:hypothetical protein